MYLNMNYKASNYIFSVALIEFYFSITDYVNELYALRNSNENIDERLPKEVIYKIGNHITG